MINRETIETITTTARIEEVIGDYVTLRRRGVNLLGLCPFHNEKTPSFTVSPVKGIFKCFGCGKAGNSVNFLMEHEHFSYPEALKYLAKKYHIEIEEEEQTPEQLQELNEKESLYNINLFAQQYFTKTLFETEEGKAIGLTYFRERGIREDVIKKFQLGYNPDKWEAFTGHATAQGYKKEYLIKTGLSIEKDDRLYDRFHARVIFPIHSASGRVIGFGGRILGGEKNKAKYVNSPESEIYSKSKTLYGIFFARSAIASKDNCYLVEGYTDVISMHQAGIENVVASSGTSLTHDQVRMIQRYTANITILYDGDPAGIKASFRGIDMIVEQGMSVRIVLFPDGEDPDSYARKHHPAEVEEFIGKHADNFILFKTRLLLTETQGDPIKKAALIKEIVNTIALIPDAISRSLYVRECATLMDVAEHVLFIELNKIVGARFKKNHQEGKNLAEVEIGSVVLTEPNLQVDPDSLEFFEFELIRVLYCYGNSLIQIRMKNEDPEEISVMVADFVFHDLETDELFPEIPIYRKIFEEYQEFFKNDLIPDRMTFLSHPDDEISKMAINMDFTPYEFSQNWKIKGRILVTSEETRLKFTVERTLLAFKVRRIDRQISEILRKLRQITDSSEQTQLQEQHQVLKKISVEINKNRLGRIITR